MSEMTEDRVDVVGALRHAADDEDAIAQSRWFWTSEERRLQSRMDALALRELADDMETLREWFRYARKCQPMIDTAGKAERAALERLASRLDTGDR